MYFESVLLALLESVENVFCVFSLFVNIGRKRCKTRFSSNVDSGLTTWRYGTAPIKKVTLKIKAPKNVPKTRSPTI